MCMLDAMATARQHAEGRPLDWIDWTYRQQEFVDLVHRSPIALFRAGNQVGKTHVGAGLTIGVCLAREIEAWVVCTSWSQAVAIMAKVWDLCPKDALAPGQLFDRRRGFGKDNPALGFANGSILRFRTTNQGAAALAGSTVDWIWIDEPTDESIYRELQKRIMRRGGKLIITLTPVNRDCTWLRALVDAGAIPEVHAPLDSRALTFARTGKRMRLDDAARTLMDDAWITEQIRITPTAWVPVVIHGEWETRLGGVFYSCFDVDKHVFIARRMAVPAGGRARWYLGIDYAAADRDFGQVASLCRVVEVPRADGGYDCYVNVVDEAVMGGIADSDEFAAEVMAMLDRNGVEWTDLGAAHGDNPVTSQWEQKSNLNTMRCIAQRLRVPIKALHPRILNAKDGRGAGTAGYDHGLRTLYGLFARDRVVVAPRCKHTIKGLSTWDLSRTHPYKDICDSVRYALKPILFRYGPGGGASAAAVVRSV